MIPFRVLFQPGLPLSDQTVYAATRAILAGQMQPGDPFPSVRALSRELKINPNTAHKAVAMLIADGLLEAQPGIGTVVARRPEGSRRDRLALLGRQVEELVVESRRVGVDLKTLQDAVAHHWRALNTSETVTDANQIAAHEEAE